MSPCESASPKNPSSLIPQEVPLWRMHLGMVVLIIHCHPISPSEAESIIGIGETKGLNHLSSLHLPWAMGLRATGVHCWWLLWCCLGLTGQMDPRRGRQHWEEGACMKINLPIFKDKDTKDAVTYQSWRWVFMVYQCAGCRDCTLLPYAIRSLQGYPGKVV